MKKTFSIVVLLSLISITPCIAGELNKSSSMRNIDARESNKGIIKNKEERDYTTLADLYFKEAKIDLAIEYYGYAFETNKNNADVAYKLAVLYFQKGDFEKADFYIKNAIKIQPNKSDYIKLSAKINKKFNEKLANTRVKYDATGQHLLKPLRHAELVSASQNYEIPKQVRNDVEGIVEPDLLQYDASYYNKIGIDYFIDKNFEKAEEYFRKAIELDSNYPQAYNNLANVLYSQEKYPEAKKILEDLIVKKPDYTDSYINLALIYRKNEDSEKELQYLNQAVSSNSDSYYAYLQRGLTFIKLNNDEKAKQDFLTASEINYKSADAFKQLGQIFFKQADYDKSLEYFNKSLEINDTDQNCLLNTARIYKIKNSFDKSIETYQKLVLLNPTDKVCLKELADIYMNNQRYQDVIDLLAEKANYDEEILNLTAFAYIKLKNFENAGACFKKLVEKNPQRPIYHYYYSICFQYLKDYKTALIEFEKAIKIQPVQLDEFIDLAKIYSDKKMYDYLYDVLIKGIKKYPNNVYLNSQLADYYDMQGGFKKSKKIRDRF